MKRALHQGRQVDDVVLEPGLGLVYVAEICENGGSASSMEALLACASKSASAESHCSI